MHKTPRKWIKWTGRMKVRWIGGLLRAIKRISYMWQDLAGRLIAQLLVTGSRTMVANNENWLIIGAACVIDIVFSLFLLAQLRTHNSKKPAADDCCIICSSPVSICFEIMSYLCLQNQLEGSLYCYRAHRKSVVLRPLHKTTVCRKEFIDLGGRYVRGDATCTIY